MERKDKTEKTNSNTLLLSEIASGIRPTEQAVEETRTHTHTLNRCSIFCRHTLSPSIIFHREQARNRETSKYSLELRVCYRFRIKLTLMHTFIYIREHVNQYANEFGPLPLSACHRLSTNPKHSARAHTSRLWYAVQFIHLIVYRIYEVLLLLSIHIFGCLCLFLIPTLSPAFWRKGGLTLAR